MPPIIYFTHFFASLACAIHGALIPVDDMPDGIVNLRGLEPPCLACVIHGALIPVDDMPDGIVNLRKTWLIAVWFKTCDAFLVASLCFEVTISLYLASLM